MSLSISSELSVSRFNIHHDFQSIKDVVDEDLAANRKFFQESIVFRSNLGILTTNDRFSDITDTANAKDVFDFIGQATEIRRTEFTDVN